MDTTSKGQRFGFASPQILMYRPVTISKVFAKCLNEMEGESRDTGQDLQQRHRV